jgi:hypothetical protein
MEEDPLGPRVGTFFYVLGFGSFILFIASDLAEKPDFDYMFVAMLLIGVGWMFRRNKPPPPSAGRFSIFRRMREDSRRRRGDRLKTNKDNEKR